MNELLRIIDERVRELDPIKYQNKEPNFQGGYERGKIWGELKALKKMVHEVLREHDRIQTEIICHILTCQLLISNAVVDGESEDIPKYQGQMAAYEHTLKIVKNEK